MTEVIPSGEAPLPDLCSCANCGWRGKISDCPQHKEREGWDGPEYDVIDCPQCEDGGMIDDFFYSE